MDDSPVAEQRKATCIQHMSEESFAKKYELCSQVKKSCHRGTFVLFAIRRSDGASLVVKTRSKLLSFAASRDEELAWRSRMEAQLRMPGCEGICELLEVVETDKRYYVVMERVEGEDLAGACDRKRLDHATAREVVKKIILAVQVMHSEARIHKDIKLENIVVNIGTTGTVRVKLIDFDTVEEWRPGGPKATEVIGTPGCIAPEGYEGVTSPALDMFGVGVIMYQLLTSRSPFSREMVENKSGDYAVGSPSMRKVHKRLRGARIDFALSPLDNCPVAAGLLESLLAPGPESRPSAEHALQHAWFALQGPPPEQQMQLEKRKSRMARFAFCGRN